ncbi:MAG: hypothetical protein ACR2QF_03170 [Geminicoccaceae bacterium]
MQTTNVIPFPVIPRKAADREQSPSLEETLAPLEQTLGPWGAAAFMGMSGHRPPRPKPPVEK